MTDRPVLVVGATGYVGGRLVPLLLESGYAVRAMARSRQKLACRPWAGHPGLQLVQGDVLDAASIENAARGCGSAIYLVHSMIAQKKRFADADRRAAQHMVTAGAAAGLQRIIYLGGLGDADDPHISHHLKSRHEVADILAAGPIPATTLRAPMILGSGSASFEILRYLVEHLPVMITPRWVRSPNQPIAIRDVLGYLKGCLENPQTAGESFDIGGPDILSYRDLLDIYAEEAGLPKRWVLPVPVLTPTLSAYWIHLISPVPASIAQPLTEGLTSAAVCRENRIRELIPLEPLSCREAIRTALDRISQHQVASCWRDAGRLLPPEWAYCGDADYAGGTILSDSYRAIVQGPPDAVWTPIAQIGGRTGWYAHDRLWRWRGWIDRCLGGVGMRRGRRDPVDVRVGDAVDSWRVLEVKADQKLVLQAEMKLPGQALLVFEIMPAAAGQTELRLTSRFLPRGLGGKLYWYAVFWLHRRVFAGMLAGIVKASGRQVVRGPEAVATDVKASCELPVDAEER